MKTPLRYPFYLPLCVGLALAAPENPRGHFQQWPGLIAEPLVRQYRGMVRGN